jgi:cell division protein FtsZ
MEKFLVIGTGESGNRLLEHIKELTDESVEFFAASDPAEVTRERIDGVDMVFVVADMEKDIDADIASIVAKKAKKLGKLTVAVVQMLDSSIAKRNAAAISENLDALLTTAYDRVQGEDIGQVIAGIVSLANSASRSIIAVDFIDVKTVLKDAKTAIFTFGSAKGENSAAEATKAALRRVRLPFKAKAKRLLFRLHTHGNFGISELREAASIIFNGLGCEDAMSIWGHMVDNQIEDDVRVSILAAEFTSGIMP